jgi:hypothetical protein
MLPISRRGVWAWKVVRLVGIAVAIAMILLALRALPSGGSGSWGLLITISILLNATSQSQLRRPVVTDERADAAPGLELRP